ncbi:Composite domain of metallo-dependent hydrolase [Coniochaeta hoffmannii]|uniref:Composite domain of metallo-dependent hydrolase n=1 Tax=Coniochaeta hoffmannii TaxID=91930 RepID=A0AA38S8K0_9PEZI|nr:Composite domain of metallo-dependent hydrolase [Coniochaeta hoffmannii]
MGSTARMPGTVSWQPWTINDIKSDIKQADKAFPRNVAYIENLRLDPELQPAKYELAGTHPESKILITDVKILDSTGREPYRGDVLIQGEKIAAVGEVPNTEELQKNPAVRVFNGKGRTLMSGLGDGHTHFTWNGGDLARLGELGVEEHVLLTVKSAQCFVDSGYTMCFGAASAKDRLDVVVRDAINAGDVPGPRYLANAREIAKPEGDLVPGITAFAAGPEEMRDTVRRHIVDIGVDNVKLSMSGEEICDARSAQDCFFTDEETAAAVDEAHRYKKRVCAHARARDSVTQCIKHGVDVIFHGSYVDDEGMEMLEATKHKQFVVPAINWLWATSFEAEAFGYSHEAAEKAGYKKELEIAVAGLREMHKRGIVVLPGGDYGFAWTPHGTYARDLEHFVKLLDFTPHEAIIAATSGVAALLMRGHELGKVQPGYYADCILVNGDPLEDITVLQDHSKLDVIIINGRVHKAGRKEYIVDTSGALSAGVQSTKHLEVDFPEVKPAMQKAY